MATSLEKWKLWIQTCSTLCEKLTLYHILLVRRIWLVLTYFQFWTIGKIFDLTYFNIKTKTFYTIVPFLFPSEDADLIAHTKKKWICFFWLSSPEYAKFWAYHQYEEDKDHVHFTFCCLSNQTLYSMSTLSQEINPLIWK